MKTAEDYGDKTIDPAALLSQDDDDDQGGNGRAPIGLLRKGYTITMGSGRTLEVIHGPAKISLTKKLARLHLHKFDNKRAIKIWLGIPPQEPRETAADLQEARRRQGAPGGAADKHIAEQIAQGIAQGIAAAVPIMAAEIASQVRAVMEGKAAPPTDAPPAARTRKSRS